MKKKVLAAVILTALLDPISAMAASFIVNSGMTSTTAQTLSNGGTGTVNPGGTLSVSGSAVAVTVTGSSTITNGGTIIQTGTGRAIRDNTGGLTLTVTNNAGGIIQTADNDVIQMNKANSNITFYNYGTLTSLNASAGGAQAIDFNAITTGSNTLHNYATGVIQANEADAVRPGVNGYVYNDGLIKSTNNPGSTDGSDGVDAQTNSGITVANSITGTIEGARHGITGGNTDVTTSGAYTMSVTNAGTIQGDNGSGINIDGFNANEVVTVANQGTITGNGITRDGDGVDVDGLVNITNSGTIQSLHAYDDTSEGVTVGGGTIVNSGTIAGYNSATNADGTVNTGTGRGITLAGLDKDPTTDAPIPTEGIYANTTVTNSGLIRGQSDSAIAVTGAANAFTVTITNLAGGVLEGGGATAAAVYTGGNNATVIDYGTITADSSNLAVDLGSGNSSLQILGGSAQINGNVSGGTGTSTLTIAPGTGNSFTYGGAISNFASVAIGSGTTTLNGASTYSGTTTLNGGTLVLGNSSAVGTGGLNVANATVVYGNGLSVANPITLAGNATFEVDNGNSATQSGVISGSYGITKTGTGTWILAGANTYTGGTTISAGTLQGDTTSLQGNITDNASLVFNQTSSGTYAGNLSGTGALSKTGSGTLTLSGTNTYTGGTTISAGTLQGNSESLQGNITNNASLIFNQASSGTYAGNLSGSGALSKTGSGTLTLSGTNTYTGGTTISAGTLQGDSTSLQGSIIDNASLVFAQNTSGTFSGSISGTGVITKSGTGTLVLDGSNPFTGTTTVQGGTLEVGDSNTSTAALGGNVTVAAGGTLRGHGTIDGNVVNNGTVWPGGSIGTLSIHGNYTQGANGILNIDATPSGQSDQLAISGTATIQGGSTVVLAQAGNWAPRTDYTILTAAQGVTGQFVSASSSLTFLTPQLSYTSDSVVLSLERNDVSFASVAQTPDQRATASAVEGLGWNSAVYNAVVETDAATAQHAFDLLSGQLYASTRTALIEDSRYVRDAINDHLLGLSNGANGISATNDGGVSAWTSGWGHWGANDSDGNASRLQANGSGLLVGADMPVGIARIGAVAGFGQNSARTDALDASAHTTATHFGVYGGLHAGQFQLQAGAAYSWQTVDSDRNVAFGNFSGTYNSRYDANTVQGYLDGSYVFRIGQDTLAPYLNVARVQVRTDAIHESGGAAALDADAATASSTYATLGLRGVFALDARGDINAHAGLGWQQAWGATTSTDTMRFQSGGDAFDISGVPLARHAGVFNGGISFALAPSFSADVSYNGQFAGHAKDQSARMSFTWTF